MAFVSKATAYPKTVQPGIPKLGTLPVGWKEVRLGDLLKEVQRPLKMEDDQEYRLVTVKRARGGVVEREHLKGNEISVKSQFTIEGGDFLVSKRQIVHGACGIVPKTLSGSIVSNEYSVLHGSDHLDLAFFNYLAHSVYFQQTCFHSSIGVHIEKMIFKLKWWLNFKFHLPPIEEQKKIAKILATWDRAIEVTEQRIANAQTQKKALMQQLLTGRKRFKKFEGQKWQFASFGELFKTANNKRTQIQKSEYKEAGTIPIIDQGKAYIVGFTDTDNVYSDLPVIIFGDHTRIIKWVDQLFCPGADGTQVLKTTNLITAKFGYYLLQTAKLPNLGYSRHMRELKEQEFRYPALPVEQDKMVALLDSAEQQVAYFAEELSKLQTQKKALMQQLLTGKRRVKV